MDAAVDWAGVTPDGERVAEANGGCGRCLSFKAEADLARGRVRYWQAMHSRAVERELVLKGKIEQLQAQLHQSERRLFGEKSERSKSKASGKEPRPGTRKRGQQRGAAGHGRRRRGEHLPGVEEIWDLDAQQRCCAQCQRPYEALAQSEDSEIIEVEVRAHRRVIRRQRYRPTCQCPAQPGIVTAAGPPKLIARTSLGTSVWVAVLIDKYLFQRPTYRWLADLRLTQGVAIAQGTLTDGLRRLLPLFEPVREAIVEKSLRARHWHADETGWPVYVKREGKSGYRWQLWVFQSREAVVFQMQPNRAGKVVQAYLSGAEWGGKLAATMFSIFQTLLLWKLNPRRWLHAYLEACARDGGRPPTDLSPFLPWEMSEPQRRQMSAFGARRPDGS